MSKDEENSPSSTTNSPQEKSFAISTRNEDPVPDKTQISEASSRDENALARSEAAWANASENPLNWPKARKWRNVIIVSAYTFIAPFASSMMAPGLPEIGEHYHISNSTVTALTLSIFLLAIAIGPLVLAPLTEMYGRQWGLHMSILGFMVFCLASIWAPNTGSLIAFRFLAGLSGSTPIAVGGSCISDVFVGRERGTAMSMYTLGPLLGPVLGPAIGGFVVETIGFRWVFILLTILAGVMAILGIPLFHESYAPIVKLRLSRRHEADPEKSEVIFVPPQRPQSLASLLKINLARPCILLTRSFVCFMISTYMALLYGYLYLMFTTLPVLFKGTYGWSTGVSGLAYLAGGVGFLVGTFGGTPLAGHIYITLTKRNNGKSMPEFRLPPAILGSFFVPIGLFWYGWAAQAQLHWMMPLVGTAIFGVGVMLVFIPCQLYLVDAFTYAASALAASWAMRALFGFIFPLFGEPMFTAIGFGGGNSLLAGLAIVIGIPFPIWLYYNGETMRMRNPLNR